MCLFARECLHVTVCRVGVSMCMCQIVLSLSKMAACGCVCPCEYQCINVSLGVLFVCQCGSVVVW